MANLTWSDIKDLKLVSDTTWARVEGSPRSPTVEASLAARLQGGPYWMLAQQWRFGELLGNDAASPVAVAVTWQRRPFAGSREGDGASELLEPRVEGEPLAFDLRLRVQAGRELARLIDHESYANCLAAFPLPNLPPADTPPEASPLGLADAATRSLHRALAGRVTDGVAMLMARRNDTLPQALQTAEILEALTAVEAWLDRTYPQHRLRPEDAAWSPSELEFRTSIALAGDGDPAVLTVDDHLGGRLDWWSFDLGDTIDWSAAQEVTERTLPTTVEFPGMPRSSYWQFEDSEMDFGRIGAGRTDLARLILVEFALVYGEDWFSVPLLVERGSAVRIGDIEVRNAFGETFVIPPSGAASKIVWDSWSTGHPAGSEATAEERARLLIVPPVTVAATNGPAVEEVILARDEMANVLWAIERFAANAAGEATSLDDVWGDRLSETPAPPDQPGLNYILVSDVPATWHPFSPRLDPGDPRGRTVALELIPFLRTRETGDIIAVRPLGELLNKEDPPGTYRLAEEAASRVPLRLVRRFERARDAAGRVHLWTTIRRLPAAPQPQSGIRFDSVSSGPPD